MSSFREQLYNLVNDQPLEDVNGVLNDVAIILCSTLYLNGAGDKHQLKNELMTNLSNIWDQTTEKLGEKNAVIESKAD